MKSTIASVREDLTKLTTLVENHIMTRLKWQDAKLNFILGFLGLILALLAVIIIK